MNIELFMVCLLLFVSSDILRKIYKSIKELDAIQTELLRIEKERGVY